MTAADQPSHHVRTHPPQPDHSKLHGFTPYFDRAVQYALGSPHVGQRALAARSGPARGRDASKMLWMAASSVASNSAAVCCAERPSTRAREKLAAMPLFLRRRALASSRV